MSPKLVKQLFYTLLFQVGLYLERCSNTFQFVVHLSFIYLPPNITMFLLLTRIHIDIHPFFFTYGFTLFPVIDALIIMIGIRDYRYGKQPFVFTLQKFQGEFSKDIFVSFEQHVSPSLMFVDK